MATESELLKGIRKRYENNLAFLLSMSEDMARARGRTDLLQVINAPLKSLFNCTRCGIGIVDKETGSVCAFLVDPDSKASHDEGYTALFNDFDINANNIINQAVITDTPVIFNLDAENKAGRLPAIYTRNLQR